MGDDKKKKHVGASAVFWLVFALILLIAFLVNRNKIIGILQRTGFFTKVFGSEPAFVMNYQPDDDEPVAELSSSAVEEPYTNQTSVIEIVPKNNKFVYMDESADSSDGTGSISGAAEEPGTGLSVPDETVSVSDTTDTVSRDTESIGEENKSITLSPSVMPVQSVETDSTPKMAQHLCFVVISGDGSVLRKEVERSIPKTITPLTAAINALLAGPNIDELEKGYMTLIPEDTQLLGASVKDGVASINFSSAFRFNKYGVEGYYGQLAQIVYTATAFSNISSVQFLIEGEKIDYLSEGVFIGAPLSRTTLY